ncbi:efflux RND transporter periplasmic adaptor subunit [Alteromonas sp. ASW11-130]|uniref:efflux RND transporter periplasmic adaptor subunit n=1 Tax=Alteromonas sp. ASW11-130 TaxID=3015775 RepID=UPI002241F7D6|nr:efflux RND transporter periplasmic adaptor subunit [Alteromonas sp. ASW11-130]MCW8092995.1 efflux RND transporter periplasmic adaptor subunit [Alteromonas sp. ASW11-130]
MNRIFIKPLAVSILSIGLGFPAAAQEPPLPPATLVEVDQILQEEIAEQLWVPGTVVSREDAQIASEVAGRVIWMAEVGQRVSIGEVLIKLDDQRLQLSLAQDKANIAKWEARVSLAHRKLDRFLSMAEQQNVSKDQLDETAAELEIARQELAQAKASKKMTEYQIAQSEVRAPFDTLVVERLQSPGEFISTGQALLRIVDPTQVEAAIRAPLTVIPFVSDGLHVRVKNNNREVLERVTAVVPVGNANSRMMELRVALKPTDFPIGSAIRVSLPHSEKHYGMTVPRDALVLRKTGAFIYQINGDNEAQQIAVTTGIGVGERIEVFGEFEATQPVITRGAERLQPGQKVRLSGGGTMITAKTDS